MTGTKKIIVCVFVMFMAVPSFAWTNNNPVEIMKIDLTELRTFIDAIRTNIGMSAYSWTDSTLTGNTMFKLAHFQDLRTATEAVATTAGATASQWGDTLASGGEMKLLHIVGPRANITALNATVNSWYCCGSYGGQSTGSVGACPGSDDSGCGTIDCDGLNYYFTEGSASATGTNYCKLRDYADLTSGRCEGINNCKDANTGDCTSYADSTAATCGTCCYATGACSSCTNYGSGTQGPTADYYFTEGSASATGTNYCKLRDYHCTGSSCGETYGDSYVATCGTCKYATGACSSCTNYGAGTDTGTCRECNGAGSEQAPADDADCGTIDCDGLNYYFTEGSASATGTNYCKLRDYADLTSSRCEGLGDCKDANTGDCTGYGDSYVATCGTCCYATGACSSCTNYGAGTQGPTGDYYWASGQTCYYRDYHCTGSSCGETYGDSYQTSCSGCQYLAGCSGGSAGYCANYGYGTNCGGSNICDGYGNCIATYCGDTHPCGVAGTNYYRYYGPGGGCGGPNGCQGTQVIGPCEDCPCAAC